MNQQADVVTAYHEAGHAVGAYLLGLPIGTIALRDPGQGDVSAPLTIQEIRARRLEWPNAVVYMLGREAERMFFGRADRQYLGHDAEGVGKLYLTFFRDMRCDAFRAELRRRTAEVVAHPGFRPAVESLAEVILRNQVVSANEATEVIRNAIQATPPIDSTSRGPDVA